MKRKKAKNFMHHRNSDRINVHIKNNGTNDSDNGLYFVTGFCRSMQCSKDYDCTCCLALLLKHQMNIIGSGISVNSPQVLHHYRKC